MSARLTYKFFPLHSPIRPRSILIWFRSISVSVFIQFDSAGAEGFPSLFLSFRLSSADRRTHKDTEGVRMIGHGHTIPLEVVASMLEMAEMAWKALEHRRDHMVIADEAQLRAENRQLRTLLADNLALLQTICDMPVVSKDCPADLHSRLLAAVESSSFLGKLELLHEGSKGGVPTPKSTNINGEEVPIQVDDGEVCWWIWITHETTPECLEEISGIDNENYVIISEENVVDGISDFVARCILEHPKSKVLTPDELQKAVARALGTNQDRTNWRRIWEAGKVIYTLSTWGIALAGLYSQREIVKAAAKGVGASTNFALKKIL